MTAELTIAEQLPFEPQAIRPIAAELRTCLPLAGGGVRAGTEAGRLCQSVLARLDPGADLEGLAERVSRATGTRLWQEWVSGPADSGAAAQRRDRELARPADPATGPGVRVVLLRYADQVADLVVVAHRAVADPRSVLRAVLSSTPLPATDPQLHQRLRDGLARLDRVGAPDWGLGNPEATGAEVLPFTLSATAETTDPEALLAGALGLVLARCTGAERAGIGLDPLNSADLDCAGGTPVAGYLAAVRHALDHPVADTAPVAGLAVGAQRPFLDPLHPLAIWIGEAAGGELPGSLWFRRSAFAPAVAERLAGMLGTAYRGLATAHPDTPIGELALLDAGQLRELAELGGRGRPLPASGTGRRIDEAVRAQAEFRPDAIALCFEANRLSYRELDERANRAAHALRAAGVRTGDRVGVCLERSLDLVVMLLAVLRAGAAYVPMDAGNPDERLAYTATDAGLAVVIAEEFPQLPGVRVLAPAALREGPSTAPEQPGTPDDTAYVIYTSGSTGRPKGVLVSHRNVAGLLAATEADFGLGTDDVWTLFHSSAFDFSVWEIWGCLATGGRLVVVPHWTARDPQQFAELLHAEQVSVLNQTPSAFSQLAEVDRTRRLPDSLRLVIFGGEPLDTRPLLAWFDRHPESRCRLVNMFGITETTVHVTAQTLGRREALAGSKSVGRPLPGWSVSVLDPAGRPVPPGVAGEIYVGGAGVAAGYLGRPELTAQRFVPDPEGDSQSAGLRYRSGDRGRLLPDGRLEHLGRLDNQVKLRGFRIELDEIRARLLDAPGVGAAAVLLRQDPDNAANARLDAYLVLSGGDVEEVRAHAARFLPEHMVPSTFTVLPALPLTPNGKLDSARLPEPLDPTAPDGELDAPDGATDLQARLHAVWQQVFGFRVGLDDDFFALGGNSLLGVQLFAAMRGAGLPTPGLRELYLNRTVRGLAEVLDRRAG
ncbi:amino acid adenylation domain-containing protein [Jatrophihabitans sp.]|uniref:amino acid adenylation domain-containing protein n=1 Tax=Jatrophihabitans sp. TaxID=1932789 RepID=UPI002D08D350|nr:amino acid adenylation domain-containing protein [Jatrophihabitans sp.]